MCVSLLKEVLGDTKLSFLKRALSSACCIDYRFPKEEQLKKIAACWYQILRSMTKGDGKKFQMTLRTSISGLSIPTKI